MKTSAIHVRVADFLRRYPPFSWLDEEALLSIAGSGRVTYHEADEILYREGEARDGRFWVVNKGAVRLTWPVGSAIESWDLRGVGDLVGGEGIVDRPVFDHTATIPRESLLYRLSLDRFAAACSKSRRASRFMSMLFASDDPSDPVDSPQLAVRDGAGMAGHFVRIGEDSSLREVTVALGEARADHAVVVDDRGCPRGILELAGIARGVAQLNLDPASAVRTLMRKPATLRADAVSEAEAILQMVDSGSGAVCLTLDGSPESPLVGVITERSLLISQGGHPLPIVRDLERSGDHENSAALLGSLNLCARRRVRSTDAAMQWLRLCDGTLRMLLRRALPRGGGSLEAGGGGRPVPLLPGAVGRGESIPGAPIQVGVLGGEDAEAWLAEWLGGFERLGLSSGIRECRAFDTGDWIDFLVSLISDPIGGAIWDHVGWFDTAALRDSDDHGFQKVRSVIGGALAQHPNFVRLLANDCLEKLPPVTIFDGYAVAADGLMMDSLDLEREGIRAIADAARVWQLESGDVNLVGTRARLDAAALRHPEFAGELSGGTRAFEILHYIRLADGDVETGAVRPAAIGRADTVLLKNAFRSVANLIRKTAEHFDVGSR